MKIFGHYIGTFYLFKGFIIMLLVSLVFCLASCCSREYEPIDVPIVAFTDANTNSINGHLYALGFGNIHGGESTSYEVLAITDNGQIRPVNIPSRLVCFEYCDSCETPYITMDKTNKELVIDDFKTFEWIKESGIYCSRQVIIHIPQGSIAYDNTFDGK